LLLTHFQETAAGYDENVEETIKIINETKSKYKYIILGGDFNFPYGPDIPTQKELTKLGISSLDAYHEKIGEYQSYVERLSKELIYLKPENDQFTGFLKEKTIDLFFVSEDFLFDFDVSTIIVKSDLSDHYPVILDFKFIDTEIKKFESELKLLFYGILTDRILKNIHNFYFCNTHPRGYLEVNDKKYRFTQDCINIELDDNKKIKVGNNLYSISEFNVLLVDFHKTIMTRKMYYLPLVNFFKKIKTHKQELN
jgi:hypothetical protein